MTTTVGIFKKAIDTLIKENQLSRSCLINQRSWKLIQDKVIELQKPLMRKEKNNDK